MDPAAKELAVGRMGDSEWKREVYLANPTIPDYGVDRLYQESDQRVWMIPCEHCGEWTCLEQEFPACLVRAKDHSVYRACKRCHQPINYRKGEWVAQYPDRQGMVGRWISQLLSPHVDLSDMLTTWQSATVDRTQFYRLRLGLPYIEAKDKLNKTDLYARLGQDPMVRAHKGPCAMGIDVGAKFHVVIADRPNDTTIRGLFAGQFDNLQDLHELTRTVKIGCCVVDKYPETRHMREWGNSQYFPVWLCQYVEESKGTNDWSIDQMEVRSNRTEVCDATHKLVTEIGKLILPRPSAELETYITQMCNIAKVKDVNPKTQVVKYRYIKTDEDHYRHATNYMWLAASKVGITQDRGPLDDAFLLKRKRGTWMTR